MAQEESVSWNKGCDKPVLHLGPKIMMKQKKLKQF
jgi:hypothetical protein